MIVHSEVLEKFTKTSFSPLMVRTSNNKSPAIREFKS